MRFLIPEFTPAPNLLRVPRLSGGKTGHGVPETAALWSDRPGLGQLLLL